MTALATSIFHFLSNVLEIKTSIPERAFIGRQLLKLFKQEFNQKPVKLEQIEVTAKGETWKLGVAGYPPEWLWANVERIFHYLVLEHLAHKKKQNKPPIPYFSLIPVKQYRAIIKSGRGRGKSDEEICDFLVHKVYLPIIFEKKAIRPKVVYKKRKRKRHAKGNTR